MKSIRGFVNQHAIAFLMVILSVVILFSFGCGSANEEDVEQPLQPEETTDTTPFVTPDTDTQAPVEEPVGLEAFTFTVDATNREAWAYFSFATGNVVEVEDAENSDAWDIGFQRTTVKLNGGISGPGMGSVVMLTETTFAAVTEAPADGYKADTEDTYGIVTGSENGWYIYTGPPTHWVLPLEDRVFVLKAADGTFAKVQFLGYYKDNENKKDSGFVTFEYVHQPDGSPNF
ncbi:MAG: HmuY family protein [Candidatus Poribacteria bacterium]|nr:HmuY family protein [Candidatus Poribacteria bacterium]